MKARSNGYGRHPLAIGLWLNLVFAAVAHAQFIDPPNVQIFVPAGSSGSVSLEPGQSGVLTYAVKNLRPYDMGPVTIAAQFSGAASNSEYLFEIEPGSRCRLTVSPMAATVSSLAVNETVICRTVVTRLATSRSDLKIAFCTWFCNVPPIGFFDLLYAGELPDVTVTSPIIAVPTGAATATIQLIASNSGSRPIASQVVGSECVEFGGGSFYPAPFLIENDFPGACPTATANVPLGCGNFTGQNFSSVVFSIGPIPARGTASCSLRLRFTQPLTSRVDIEMAIRNNAFTFPDGTVAFDAVAANNATRMGASPSAPYAYVPVPMLRSELLALLALLLVTGVAWRCRSVANRG